MQDCESREPVAMRIPPTWEVEMLRQRKDYMKAFKELIIKFKAQFEPYIKPPAQNTRSVVIDTKFSFAF